MKFIIPIVSAVALCVPPALTSCTPGDEAEEAAVRDVTPQEVLVTDLASLLGSEWRLTDLCGGTVAEDAGVTLAFMPDGRVTGGASVNRYNGPIVIRGGRAEAGPFASTRMAGPPEAMEREHAYLNALASAKSISTIGDDQLVIAVDGEDLPLRFEAVKQP